MAKLKRSERIAEAIDYKMQGISYAEIASAMKITAKEAQVLVYEGLSAIVLDEQEGEFLLDLARIDAMLTSIYPTATQGDRESISTVLQLRKERDELRMRWRRQESFVRLAPVEDDV